MSESAHALDSRPLRVVDFSTHLSGPLATHLLTELGADVIKVENPRTGDGNRGLYPIVKDLGMMHLALNSGARSIAVDRRSEEWPEIIAACARWADAVVVGARPVDARRRGMDFETMKAANDRLVYVAVSGFGDVGPWKDYTAHGQTIDSFAGIVDVEQGEHQPVTRPGWRTAGTTLGGMFTAMGVLAAIYRRDHGLDRAQYLSVSLWHSAMWWSWRDVTMLANTGERWLDYSDLGSRYSLYRTKDDRVLLSAPAEKRFWDPFVDLLGLPPEWKDFGDWSVSGMCHGEGPDFQHERIAIQEKMSQRTLDEWVADFVEAEIPVAPILTLEEAMASEHAAENDVLGTVHHRRGTMQVANSPVRFADASGHLEVRPAMSPPPEIGEHTDEIRAELGLSSHADE